MISDRNSEFKFVEIPNDEDVLMLLGYDGIKEYGIYHDGEMQENLHFHNLMEIGICRWGKGEVFLDHKWYPYKSGDIMVVPKNHLHTINSHGENSFWEHIYIKPQSFLENKYKDYKYKDYGKKWNRYLEETESRSFIKCKEKVQDLEAEINLIMNQKRVQAYGYKECMRGLIYAMLMEIIKINHIDQNKPEIQASQTPQKIRTLSAAIEFIEENYNRELHISDIANAACVSETALRHLFMECCAMSPMQYVKKFRIDEACRLMKHSDAMSSQIAYMVGFENKATFISNFKKIYGCTPKQWERQYFRKTGKLRKE